MVDRSSLSPLLWVAAFLGLAPAAAAQKYCVSHKGFEPMPSAASLRQSVKPVTRADYQAKAARRFAKYDANNDAKIVKSELPANRFGSKALKRFDRNHDGVIDRAEWTAGMVARFDKRDVDHNGVMTGDETGARYDGRVAGGQAAGRKSTSPPPAQR